MHNFDQKVLFINKLQFTNKEEMAEHKKTKTDDRHFKEKVK